MTLRKLIFWPHLIAGIVAGIVIFIMSVTGVLLMYERQITAWADREFRSAPQPGAKRVPMDTVLARLREERNAPPTSLIAQSDPAAPVEAQFGRDDVVYLDAYSGAILGQGSRGVRRFFQSVTDWHRWLSAQGTNRATGRAITGASNLLFLFIVLSGIYIWLPRKWTRQHLQPIVLFRSGLSGKARDFNWHNAIGIWCAVPLFFIVISGAVISYPWATNLIYTLTGTHPPASPGPAPAGSGSANLNELWARAEAHVPDWRSISLRLPPQGRGPFTFTIDQVHRGRPDKRFVLTLNGATGEVIRVEDFAEYSTGRKVRSWLRWIHTGEAGGLPGQTIAGIASLGAAVLVYTGWALAWRRLRAWRVRQRQRSEVPREQTFAA